VTSKDENKKMKEHEESISERTPRYITRLCSDPRIREKVLRNLGIPKDMAG